MTTDARATDATGLTQVGGSTKVIAGSGSGSYELVSRMSPSAVDACKSQTFTMALTAALSSAAS